MPLPDQGPDDSLTLQDKQILLDKAFESIESGIRLRQPLEIESLLYPNSLQQLRSSFVTLRLRGSLRGCIGSLEATVALIKDVADNAYNTAFSDPRFSPLTEQEFIAIDMSISILSRLEPMSCESEEDLIRQLRPGLDGLVLEEGALRGTFLPSLWETIHEPREFIRELKRKAGFSTDHWSKELKIYRYTTETVEREPTSHG